VLPSSKEMFFIVQLKVCFGMYKQSSNLDEYTTDDRITMLVWNLLTLGVLDLIWFYRNIKFQFKIKHLVLQFQQYHSM
jgi:hypothetical protein